MKRTRAWFIALLILLVAGVSGWFFAKYYLFPTKQGEPLVEMKEAQPQFWMTEEEIPVKIFYPSGEGTLPEERKVKASPLQVTMAENVIGEYLKGLREGLRDTKLLGVYKDKDNILYVDLSDEFRRSFSGDARQEYYLLRSLFETVVKNVAGIEDVKIAIEGKEIESIGGHFYALYPLRGTVAEE